MTLEDRQRIFCQEYISYHDIALMFDIDEATASTKLQAIKSKGDRLHIKGKIHIQDFFNYFGITNFDRYKIADDTLPTA